MKLYVLLIYLVHVINGEAATNVGIFSPGDVVLPKTCTVERVKKEVGYSCVNMNLREIPQHLKSEFQILDVSFNRIRELNQRSFQRYTSIKYLYLFENIIQTIEKNTFKQLIYLEAIDLSTNGLTTLPMELFSLPYLRNFYASDNSLTNLENDLKNLSKPISAPLQLMNIANCNLNKVPDLGPLPDLWHLNISSNGLQDADYQQLTPLCGLKSIDLNYTKIPPCPCQTIAYYLRKRFITMPNGMNCDTSAKELTYCPDPTNSTLDLDDNRLCTSLQNEKKMKENSKLTWMSVFGGILGFLVVFMGTLYLFHRRNKRRTQEREQFATLKRIHQSENQTVELLINKEST